LPGVEGTSNKKKREKKNRGSKNQGDTYDKEGEKSGRGIVWERELKKEGGRTSGNQTRERWKVVTTKPKSRKKVKKTL